MPKKLMWTDYQRELASLAQQGKNFSDLVELGYGKSSVSKVLNALKKGDSPVEGMRSDTESGKPGIKGDIKQGTPPKGLKGRPIEVGKILITPENWGVSQLGAIIILDTYARMQRDMRYEGTVGDFICEAVQIIRRFMNYGKEVEYVRQASERGGISEAVLAEGDGQHVEEQ